MHFFLVQEFIKESEGSDIRCFIMGDKVIAAMQRKAPIGEFRANMHQGATSELIKLSPIERRTAVQATKAMGLRVAGVDIVRSNRGPLVLEVNSSPGIEYIEKTSQKDIAGMIIKYIEINAKSTLNSKINKG